MCTNNKYDFPACSQVVLSVVSKYFAVQMAADAVTNAEHKAFQK